MTARHATTPVILDADPGMGLPYADIDDNLALLFALGCDELDVALATIVQGNTPAVSGYQSLKRTLEFLRVDLPVSLGSRAPIRRAYCPGQELARRSIGEIAYSGQVDVVSEVENAGFAVADMARVLEQADRPVTIAAVGPLTNVAVLLHQRPDLVDRIDSVVIMGGAFARGGNVTPFAEFNIWVDPLAAAMVFDSPVRKVAVGLDITTKVEFVAEDFGDALSSLARPQFTSYVTESVAGWLEVVRHRGGRDRGFHPHDPIALGYLVQPDLFETERMTVSVDECTGATTGRPDPQGTTAVCTGIDATGFSRLFFERFARVPLK